MAMGETELYEIAYDLYGKVFEGVSGETLNDKVDTAICETVDRMSGMVSNEDELKKYLMSRISREKEEDTVSVMLGEEAENSTWWDDFKEENPEKLNFWNRYSNYLFSDKHWEKSAIKKSIGHPTDIKCFLISIAIRNCRGEICKPNTMLIHVARIKNMHNQLARRVREYFFDELEPMIIDGDKATKDEILNLIREDYVPVTEEMQRDFEKYMEGSDIIPEDEIYNEILRLVGEEKIRINVINGDSQDVLSYKDHEGEEYNVIAIGGDKFSRGLTLEGLSISYFTRESKYYDTLMQMGRWFGFRPKYADLCRVFITEDIYRWFARIAFATDDLRQQITYMCDENAKPKDFGLRVATHPELKISSPRKVKSGTMQRLNFSNTLTVTRDIDVDIDQYNTNYDAVNHLFAYASKIYSSAEHFEKLGRKTDNDHLFLEEVESSKILL